MLKRSGITSLLWRVDAVEGGSTNKMMLLGDIMLGPFVYLGDEWSDNATEEMEARKEKLMVTLVVPLTLTLSERRISVIRKRSCGWPGCTIPENGSSVIGRVLSCFFFSAQRRSVSKMTLFK